MTNRKRLAAVCLALMGLGIVGEGVALAQRPPQPTSPPGRTRCPDRDAFDFPGEPGRCDEKRPEHSADPVTGPGNQFKNR